MDKTLRQLALSLGLFITLTTAGNAQSTMKFLYNGPEANSDQRRTYSWRVLKTALELTRSEYGPYSMEPITGMTESRAIVEMQSENPAMNTMVLPSRHSLLDVLIPVRIPVDRGLLGFRVFLIREEDQPIFDSIKSMEDLRRIEIGQGFDWVDRKILTDAGLTVVSGSSYEGLLGMLMNKRFNAFSRSIFEADREFTQRADQLPGLAIEKNLLLYYPLPAYFWFPNSTDGKLRAKRVETGLKLMLSNGTLQKMFKETFSPTIEKLDLKHRRVFRISNSQLGPEEPLADSNLWYNPLE